MGWMAKRRLRTGPTAAVSAKPDPAELLRIVQLADPDARADGGDILAADTRIHAAVEAEPELVGGELETVWALRVAAEGPLPFDYFDRYLAEGIAFRLGGLAVCRGEVSDPSDEGVQRGAAVILPVRPADEELAELLEAEPGEDDAFEGTGFRAVVVPLKTRPPAVRDLLPFATELTAVELRGDDLEKVGALALSLAEGLQGIAVDRWCFRIDAPGDLL
ncbi:hypothetical protein ACIBKY_00710 [Nonomuraea sp. NPDC050394]|uniref:hypothetical protein n=1 Tax=Nonomuraea sp. NPDC050394 TaxID=3364363 RepID=UPI003793DF16